MSKSECIKSIKYSIDRTKRWREGVLQKWPEDTRNSRAIELLGRFSEDVPNMSEEQWASLASHFHWSNEYWHESLSTVTRRVGYHSDIKTLAAFIDNLASVLSRNAQAVA